MRLSDLRGTRVALGCVVGMAALGFGASTALAGPSVKVGTGSVSINGLVPPFIGTATAKCPGSSKLISGGFFGPAEPGPGTSPDINSFSSYRSAKKSWTASAQNFGGTGTLTSYAYCLKGAKVKSATSTVTVPDGLPAVASATATCPKRTKVISGGFQAPSYDPSATGSRLFPISSQRSGNRSWTASAYNDGGAPGSLIAIAYCVKGSGPKARSKTSPLPDGSVTANFTTSIAACKKHELLVSGGFATSSFDPSGTSGPLTFYTHSFKGGGQSWTNGIENDGKAGSIVTTAYCYKV